MRTFWAWRVVEDSRACILCARNPERAGQKLTTILSIFRILFSQNHEARRSRPALEMKRCVNSFLLFAELEFASLHLLWQTLVLCWPIICLISS